MAIHYIVDILLSPATFSIYWKSNSDEHAEWTQRLFRNAAACAIVLKKPADCYYSNVLPDYSRRGVFKTFYWRILTCASIWKPPVP